VDTQNVTKGEVIMYRFSVEEKVWLPEFKTTGIVKQINKDKFTITYFDKDKNRQTGEFEYKQIRRYHPPLQIKIKYLDPNMPKIQKTQGSDWIDLRSAEEVTLKAGEYALIPLGIAIQMPRGYEFNIVPRSSTFKNFGIILTNHYAVIDNSYCGNDDWISVPVVALRDTVIKKYDRICQGRVNRNQPKVRLMEVNSFDTDNRGGLGSTGVK